MRVLRGVAYMTKSSGPRTEHWGTPQEEVCQEDRYYLPPGRGDLYCVGWGVKLYSKQTKPSLIFLKKIKVAMTSS